MHRDRGETGCNCGGNVFTSDPPVRRRVSALSALTNNGPKAWSSRVAIRSESSNLLLLAIRTSVDPLYLGYSLGLWRKA